MKSTASTVARFGTMLVLFLLGLSASAQLTSNQANNLKNGGFEQVAGSTWTTFGNASIVLNPGAGFAAPHRGFGEAKMFGTFPGTSGMYQSFSVKPGQAYDCNGFGQNWSGDAMQTNNLAFIRLTFFDASNNEISAAGINSSVINSTTPTDTWIQYNIRGAVAPANAAYGRVYLLFIQPGTNGGSAWYDDIVVNPSFPNLIQNGSFEYSLTGNWTGFGNAFQSTAGSRPNPNSGSAEALLYGTFPGDSGLYQDFTAKAGTQYQASGFCQNWSGNLMQANNSAFIRISFLDANNNEISGVNSDIVTSATMADKWLVMRINPVVAPVGTTHGRIYVLFTQPGSNGGAAWFDDIQVTSTGPVILDEGG